MSDISLTLKRWLKKTIRDHEKDMQARYKEFGNCPSVDGLLGAVGAYRLVLARIEKVEEM